MEEGVEGKGQIHREKHIYTYTYTKEKNKNEGKKQKDKEKEREKKTELDSLKNINQKYLWHDAGVD